MKFLLIEESQARAGLLIEHLRLSGSDAECVRVATPEELRRALESGRFDAVVSDAAHADMGVEAVMESVATNGSAPTFVVLEASGEEGATELLRVASQWGAGASPGSASAVQMIQATLDAIPDAALAVEFSSDRTIFNVHFNEMWGVEDLPPPLRLAIDVLIGDAVSTTSGTLDLADGRTIEWHSAPQIADGAPLGRVWTFRDVSANVRAQRALEQSEAKFRSLIGNIPDVLWTADARGRITFVSPNVIALDGSTPEEVCSGGAAGWLRRVHPDDREIVRGAYGDLFEHELAFDVEYRIQHKDGRWVWLHDRAMITYDLGGVRCADGVISNVTARKESEIERQRLTHERELLFDSAAEGIYGVDCQGRTTFVNRAATEMLGYDAAELLGRRMEDVVHERCQSECDLEAALQRGEQRRVIDDVFLRKDGTPISVEYVASPIIDRDAVRGVVVIFSDTTARRALERSLEQANRVASLGRVAATIAHEFNNVLMGIQPFAEIARRAAADNPKVINASEQIAKSVQRGKRVAQEILRFTRPAVPVLKPVDLGSALEHLSVELRATLPPSCAFELNVVDPKLEILADWPQLEQVVANLVVNARDAMEGTGRITLTVEDCARAEAMRRRVPEPHLYAHLSCADTGTGMKPEVIERIFEPLYTTKRSGTGLGLAVAQQVVLRHGGFIFVDSEPGKGTIFHILLKKSAAAAEVADAPSPAYNPPAAAEF